MNAIIHSSSTSLTMSSREIAELTEKRHDHVLRDIRTMLIGLYGGDEVSASLPEKDTFEVFCERMGWGIASPKLGNQRIQGVAVSRDGRGFISEIALDYNHSMTLVSGYNVKLRKTIIDRWQELEVKQSAPIARTPAQMLVVMAQQLVEFEQEQERQANELARLQENVAVIEARTQPENKHFTVAGYCNLMGRPVDIRSAAVLGRKCAALSRDQGLIIGDVRDPRFGRVHSYHESVLATVLAMPGSAA